MSDFFATLALVALAILGSTQSSSAESADDNAPKAILVTGASSGIGLNITKTLAASGYFVYAGARKQAARDYTGWSITRASSFWAQLPRLMRTNWPGFSM